MADNRMIGRIGEEIYAKWRLLESSTSLT